ncbi:MULTISPECIES: hypothetical protein [Vallitalea]|uniref:Uncharacterized protein n=1 Tax=Vallitalea maricola TaxID=3074433 RepID=A0ACB5UGU0_9FIRM|nr:hypothetical protein [Vallitalea guaymasensis]GMQ62172.1 hypothetical protein AN2V17_14030 [Vallitalea sp. AN17-2]
MIDITEKFNYFAVKMLDATYRDFINTDVEYQELDCYLDNNKHRFETIINSLNEQDGKFVKEYITKQSDKLTCANQCLYIASYKDCIRLLKLLGVI